MTPYVVEFFKEIACKDIKVLTYEEAQHKEGGKPDLVIVVGPSEEDRVTIAIEIEPTKQRAISNPIHGVNQLLDYEANIKYLAMPEEIYDDEIFCICANRGIIPLIVSEDGYVWEELTAPISMFRNGSYVPKYKSLRERWNRIHRSTDYYRHIKYRKIVDSEQ